MSNDKKSLFSKLSPDMQKKINDFLPTWAALKVEMAEVTPTPVKMGEMKLQDGTMIKYTGDSLAEGSEIIIVTNEGEVPAPEGDHMLEDGSVLTVSIQDGKSIATALKPAEQKEEMSTEAEKKVAERVTKIVEKFFEAQFKAQEKLIKDQATQIENLKLKLGKVSAKVIENTDMLIAFGEIPMEDPIEIPIASTKKENKKDKLVNKLHSK
jgi:hypothetical protein